MTEVGVAYSWGTRGRFGQRGRVDILQTPAYGRGEH